MSMYSGKCDLADLISGLGGWFNKDGKPVKFGDQRVGAFYSDEWLDFLEFKKRTRGVIYQHHKVQVSLWNQEDVAQRCSGFEIIPHSQTFKDSRYKDGVRTEQFYTYKYWGKEYNLKELNKKGVYVTLEIHFDTLLDLIPYYPYIVCACASNLDSMHVVISQLPYPIEERNESIESGGKLFDSWSHYAKVLQDHYRDVVLQYYNPIGRERYEKITFDFEDGKYIGTTTSPIDTNFDIKWFTDRVHWTDPKVIDDYHIEMSPEDFEGFLGSEVTVYYVAQRDYKIDLH